MELFDPRKHKEAHRVFADVNPVNPKQNRKREVHKKSHSVIQNSFNQTLLHQNHHSETSSPLNYPSNPKQAKSLSPSLEHTPISKSNPTIQLYSCETAQTANKKAANAYLAKSRPTNFGIVDTNDFWKQSPFEQTQTIIHRKSSETPSGIFDRKPTITSPRSDLHKLIFQQKLLKPVQISSKLGKTLQTEEGPLVETNEESNSFQSTRETFPQKDPSVLRSLESMYFQELKPIRDGSSKLLSPLLSPYAKKKKSLSIGSKSQLDLSCISTNTMIKTDKSIALEALCSPYRHHFPQIRSPNKSIKNQDAVTFKEMEMKANILHKMKQMEKIVLFEGNKSFNNNSRKKLPLVMNYEVQPSEEIEISQEEEMLFRSNHSRPFFNQKAKSLFNSPERHQNKLVE